MGERLRIGLHVGQLLQPVPGGIGRVTEMLCHELPRLASVVAFAGGPRSARQTVVPRVGAPVEFRRLRMPSPSCQYELWHRTRRPKLRLDVDVVHAPSLAIPPCACPLVVSINDVAFLRHPDAFTSHGVRFHRRGLELARREAAAVIVPSRFTRDELVAEGFDPTRIHHVPLALPNESRDPSTDEHTGISRSDPYILAPGTVEPRKDHASLVAAFARARARRPTLSLIIAGALGWLTPEQRVALDRPGVKLLGYVSDAELDVLYRNATVVVSASLYEGFGLTVLEALTRGKAVIATNIPAHRELVGDAARLVPPRDVEALAGALDELLEDDASRESLGRAAARRAGEFSLDAMVAGHLGVYETVARAREVLPPFAPPSRGITDRRLRGVREGS